MASVTPSFPSDEAERAPPLAIRRTPAGPGAFYLTLDAPKNAETSRRLARMRAALHTGRPAGVHDVVAGYTSLLIEHRVGLEPGRIRRWLDATLSHEPPESSGEHHTVPVLYGEGADSEVLEQRLALPWREIVRLHQEALYTVAFVGFTPGFPYLLGLPDALRTLRRDSPRARIPPGSVAIADEQAGIYPSESPGGWWVLGRTDLTLFDPRRDPPVALMPGDTLRFNGVDALSPPPATLPEPAGEGPIALLEAWPGSVSLQGAPRWGVGAYGLAQSGPFDPVAAALANGLVGNAPEAGVLEVIANPLTLHSDVPLVAAVTGGGLEVRLETRKVGRWTVFEWPPDATLELRPARGVSGMTSYLAVQGGFDAHPCLGSVSTDARARVGGLGGRFLESGDRLTPLRAAAATLHPYAGRPRYPDRIRLRLYPGPQADPAAFARLLGTSYRLRTSDRTGARLEGAPLVLARHDIVSEGVAWGAVQVPPDGQPIVLLADRGRTGGYAKPAQCDPRDLWQLAQAKAGTEVWFVPGGARAR